ncbi:MAG: hypothetical protein U0573_04580 [Phycisphaerales bacterium]|nr:hypothetical protein [Planctomycetota bacterium]
MFTSIKNRPAVLLAAALVLAGIAGSALAGNTVVISDSNFANTDWTLTNFGNRVATATQTPAGFVGTGREVSHPLNGSSNVLVFHKFNTAGGEIKPANGAITSLDFAIRFSFVSGVGVNGHGLGFALEQGGVAYRTASAATGISATWTLRNTTALTASDFTRYDGQPGNPDFSTSGAPIRFGFRTGNLNAGQVINQIVRYDDFSVSITRNKTQSTQGAFPPGSTDVNQSSNDPGTSGNTAPVSDGAQGEAQQTAHSRAAPPSNGSATSVDTFIVMTDPSAQIEPSKGAADTVQMTIKHRRVKGQPQPTTGPQKFRVAVKQGADEYVSKAEFSSTPDASVQQTDYTTTKTPRLKESDFKKRDGSPGQPDFKNPTTAPAMLGYSPKTDFPATPSARGTGTLGIEEEIVNYDDIVFEVSFVACKSDLTADGIIDDTDFVLFATAYDILDCADPAMPAGCPADSNGDGIVDDSDFVQFAEAYDILECP